MAVVRIFLSIHDAGLFEPLEHGDTRFEFSDLARLDDAGLIDGSIWIFIDWVMDEISGLELCRRLRADQRIRNAHITMVLEENDPEHCRRALRAGADDYLVGPLDREKILDRVLALQMGQSSSHVLKRFERANLLIDFVAQRAMWATNPIELSPNEFRLLRFFAENANRVLSREEVIEGIGKKGTTVDSRIVEKWVSRLRQRLEAAGANSPLRTLRSIGYVFDLPDNTK